MNTGLTQRVLVVGGMNMDILGLPFSEFQTADSLIGRVELHPGGVGHNIAAWLRRLDAAVELLTVIGNDAHAEALRASCAILGIGLGLSLQVDAPSPVYMAIHDNTGEMRAAVNDMRALEFLNPEYIRQSLANQSGFDACVLDANLDEGCLLAAANAVKTPIIADPVSAAKCSRLLPILPNLTAIKPNLLEARTLSGEDEPGKAADWLLLMGVKQVYISLGRDGLFFADAGEKGLLPARQIHGTAVTGAGDAMAAGIAFGVAKSLSARETALLGLRSAEHFLLGKQAHETDQ